MDNTEGFTQAELDKMNDEVELELEGCSVDGESPDYYQCLQWAEEKVLKKYGGA
jgi:hypothetical protein